MGLKGDCYPIILTYFLIVSFRKTINTSSLSFLDSFTKREGSGSTSKVDSNNAQTKPSSKAVNTSALNSLIDEDIGECVQQQTKPKHKKKARAAEKRKLNQENCSNTESSVCVPDKAAKKIKSVDQTPLNSVEKKPKECLKNSNGGKGKNQSESSEAVKEPQDVENYRSRALVKQLKAVNKLIRNCNSVDKLREFLQGEEKNRQENVKGRVSRFLKGRDWSEFTKYVRKRLKIIRKLRLEYSEAAAPRMDQLKVRIKFWLLFPHLNGRKPGNWQAIVQTLAT